MVEPETEADHTAGPEYVSEVDHVPDHEPLLKTARNPVPAFEPDANLEIKLACLKDTPKVAVFISPIQNKIATSTLNQTAPRTRTSTAYWRNPARIWC